MTDRPLLFSAAMVRALLEGQKTQTRRVLKPIHGIGDPKNLAEEGVGDYSGQHNDPKSWGWPCFEDGGDASLDLWPELSGYKKGDRLWVKETWLTCPSYDNVKPTLLSKDVPLHYLADDLFFLWNDRDAECHGKNRVSIHMPRWASRLTLYVTEVRVQRLQDINRGDAMAEGCPSPNMAAGPDPRDWYRDLWNQLNGEGAWERNPWVVAITFTVLQRNIDQ